MEQKVEISNHVVICHVWKWMFGFKDCRYHSITANCDTMKAFFFFFLRINTEEEETYKVSPVLFFFVLFLNESLSHNVAFNFFFFSFLNTDLITRQRISSFTMTENIMSERKGLTPFMTWWQTGLFISSLSFARPTTSRLCPRSLIMKSHRIWYITWRGSAWAKLTKPILVWMV